MTIYQPAENVVKSWTIDSFNDFVNKFNLEEQARIYYGVKPEEDYSDSVLFEDDNAEIEKWLRGFSDSYTVKFLDDYRGEYWEIEQIEEPFKCVIAPKRNCLCCGKEVNIDADGTAECVPCGWIENK